MSADATSRQPVESKGAVLRTLETHGARIRALGVARLSIFGSFARDRVKATSDVDLLVEFEAGKKTFDRLLDLALGLETLLGRRVELVTAEGLSPHIGPAILREAEDVPLGPRVSPAHR